MVEEKDMLRLRTQKVFGLMAATDHHSVCMVTHKGYLRELERGYLGQPDATEFANCEVRVYRVTLDVANVVPIHAERLYPPSTDYCNKNTT